MVVSIDLSMKATFQQRLERWWWCATQTWRENSSGSRKSQYIFTDIVANKESGRSQSD
jgi:hypothetical protein